MKFPDAIYYVVRLPKKWVIMPHHGSEEGVHHAEWWPEYLAGYVAEQWAPTLKRQAAKVQIDLENLPYGFPRGRLRKNKSVITILHGNDLTPAMGLSRADIIDAFSLQGHKGKILWRLDEHEQCQQLDKDELRSVLRLAEDWRAA